MSIQSTHPASPKTVRLADLSLEKVETVSKVNSLSPEVLRRSFEGAQSPPPIRASQKPTWPSCGNYHIQSLKRWLPYFTAEMNGSNMIPFEFVLYKVGEILRPETVNNIPYKTKITRDVIHFSQLFLHGKKLLQYKHEETSLPEGEVQIFVQSADDLANFNSKIMHLAEKYLFDQIRLADPNAGTDNELRLRLTKTEFLDPTVLSEETNNEISEEDAQLLITCLGLKKGKKQFFICDPTTANFSPQFHPAGLYAKQPQKLVFLDPSNLNLKSPTKKSQDNDRETAYCMFEGTKLLVQVIAGTLVESLSSDTLPQNLIHDLIQASEDHEQVYSILDNLENYFDGNMTEFKNSILEEYQDAFRKLREMTSSLANKEEVEEETKFLEAKTRINAAIEKKDTLNKLFNKHKDTILQFIKISSKKYQIENPRTLKITWNIQGVGIEETLKIEKSCAISRRVRYPEKIEGERDDLVYRNETNSIVSKWNELRDTHGITDTALAEQLLDLYNGKDCESCYKPFLPFLVVLLLGKEPAYDTASITSNYIMLLSVLLDICSFEEAIDKMPMIPQGAIAAKQFLLHVTEHTLDASAGVQHTRSKKIPKSTFLPSTTTFTGPAQEWISTYTEVAVTAMLCCRSLFLIDLDLYREAIRTLMTQLEKFWNNEQQLDIWSLPGSISTFTEKRALTVGCLTKELGETIRRDIASKNRVAKSFLTSCKENVEDPDSTAEQCAKFLMSGIDPSNDKIQKLRRIIYEEDKKTDNNWIMSYLKEKLKDELDPSFGFYICLESTIESWDAISTFQEKNISPDDYSFDSIRKMNQAWDEYFIDSMKEYTEDNSFETLRLVSKRVYRVPTPFYKLGDALDPEGSGLNEEDPQTSWAISYLLAMHPLATS